ncbi:Putative serine/threonine-protein kinase, active [Septoria linicola]|uniref:Serine/threonine-protein kinase, active n=1 Tax=Septoria linicola TaxID=215465 RepID=A0A9Q9EIC6_9PEZI|nr:putative serine/threonine-protein kinase, active [Septoria linicola]USW52651.1 Putative serine/threonine-protein kinase, active [Septoria linicola]
MNAAAAESSSPGLDQQNASDPSSAAKLGVHGSNSSRVAAPPHSATTTTNRNSRAYAQNATVLPPLDTASAASTPHRSTNHLNRASSPASAGLSIRTTCLADPPTTAGAAMRAMDTPTIMYETEPVLHHNPTSPSSLPTMGSSLRSNMSTTSLASSLSPGSASALPSPYLAAMADLTPLPSPLVGNDLPLQWRIRQASGATRSREGSLTDSVPGHRAYLPPTSPDSPSKRKKGYGSLMHEAAVANAAMASGQEQLGAGSHTRNRSISDFKPETLHNTRPRHVTIGQGDVPDMDTTEYHIHREAHLAEQRGLTSTSGTASSQLPTPPASNASIAESDDADDELPYLEDGTASEYLEIHCGIHNKRRKFRQLRALGKGTFSTVMLATREKIPAHPTPEIEEHLDPAKLVAVKIVEHGPAGGADEERIETSLKREVEMLKSVSHPSLIHLKACEYQPMRALLVLTYCPGGDLFDFASEQRELLTPRLIQRMFAELVSAVKYLHSNGIVHRDIKLENVLVNLREADLRAIENPLTHPTPLITLTDLGLSRRIPAPPEPPFLTTRCGSEDYAAPEILLGQPYDGRLTDGWALGVLLYALMEARLPFDAPPGKPDRSRNTHRIARCDWIWCRFGDEDGDWDAARGKDFEGANLCVEALLKKVRMGRKSLEDVEKFDWVQQGIQVSGGLQMRPEDEESL